jgi:CheY-like chemotaxis protein
MAKARTARSGDAIYIPQTCSGRLWVACKHFVRYTRQPATARTETGTFSGRGICHEQSAMPHERYKILVVDDEHAIAATLTRILKGRGYETAVAFSGEEAIEMACTFQPDCVVSDVTMGEINGIDAATEILRALPECKVLLISGNAGYGDLLENARARGFDFDILLKPVPPAELLERIAQMLAEPGGQSHE